MVNCFALVAQEVHFVQEARYSIQLDQIHNIELVCKSLEGELKLLVLFDAASTELGFAAAVEQTTAEIAHSELDQVSEVIGGKLLFTLNLVLVALLGRCLI